MKTLHITGWKEDKGQDAELKSVHSFLSMFIGGKDKEKNEEREKAEEKRNKDLLVELYHHCLKDDPKFHFFYEPEIIIRISDASVLEKASAVLTQKEISYETYDYPSPEGEGRSVAALTLSADDHHDYMERVIHTMFNPRSYTRKEEGLHLATLAIYKCGFPGLQEAMDNFRS